MCMCVVSLLYLLEHSVPLFKANCVSRTMKPASTWGLGRVIMIVFLLDYYDGVDFVNSVWVELPSLIRGVWSMYTIFISSAFGYLSY